MDGYIYVIHCTGSTYYKIGITHGSVEKRLQDLQIGSPYKLTIVMTFKTVDPEGDEYKVHELCKDCKVSGEWYDLGPQMYCNVILAINPLMVDYMKVGYVPPTE